jgi:ABC-type sugar transport system permease subunit
MPWQHTGYAMVLFLAGPQGIPEVYHEAATVDGAGPWRRLRHVTLPLLAPTFGYSSALSFLLVVVILAFTVV